MTLVDLPQNGTFTTNPDGSWTYTPDANFEGSDSLTYRLSDGLAQSELGTVNIDVLNRGPSSADDQFDLTHDLTFASDTASVFDNDVDLDGDTLTAQLVTDASFGTLTLNADGTFTYTPNSGFVGQDEFRYQVTDGIETSKPVVVSLDVTNSEPVATQSRLRVTHDQTLTVAADSGLLSSAIDADDDTLSVTVEAQPLYGTLTVAADGSFDYVPNAGFSGTDTFVYSLSDGVSTSASTLVTIDVQNTAPSVASDVIYADPGDGTVTFLASDLTANDTDFEGDTLTVSVVTPPPKGTLAFNGNTFTYTRDPSFPGSVAFTYSVSDGATTSNGTAIIAFGNFLNGYGTVSGSTNLAPVAGDDVYSVDRNGALDVGFSSGLLSNDFDPNGDDLTVVVDDEPVNGTVTVTDDGEFVYVPTSGFTGTDTFTYHVTDGYEPVAGSIQQSNTATVTITVSNTAPTASNKTYSTHHGTTLDSVNDSLDHATSDAEADTLTYSVVTDVSNGTLTLTPGGSFTYAPDAGFVGTDSFTYKVNDGALDSVAATVTINVTNTVPVARTQYFRGHQGEEIDIPASGVLALASDFDVDPLTAVLVAAPSNGTLSLNASGAFTYTPNAGFVGVDTFTYKANDGAEDSSPATVTLDIQNIQPDAINATYSVHHGDELTIRPRIWDADGDKLEIKILTKPTTLTYPEIGGGNTNTYGPLTYTAPHAVTTETVTFQTWDGAEWSNPATITLNVTNTKPFAIDAFRAIRPNETLTVELFPVYATDPDGDPLTVANAGSGTNSLGSYTLSSAGVLTFTSDGTVGEDAVTFTVSDLAEDGDPEQVRIHVINTAPVAFDRQFDFHHRSKTGDSFTVHLGH